MTTLRGALQGVFFLPCKVACLHGVVTLFSFLTLQIEFPYFAAFMVSCLMKVEPATHPLARHQCAHAVHAVGEAARFAAHPFQQPHSPQRQPATSCLCTPHAL